MSTSPKHSPGPWRWRETGENEYAILDQDNDYVAMDIYAITPADRALIAAAPKMLEALKALNLLAMEWERARYGKTHKEMQGYLYQPEIYDAQAAIAKAEGRVLE
jgi:hypothetical protein